MADKNPRKKKCQKCGCFYTARYLSDHTLNCSAEGGGVNFDINITQMQNIETEHQSYETGVPECENSDSGESLSNETDAVSDTDETDAVSDADETDVVSDAEIDESFFEYLLDDTDVLAPPTFDVDNQPNDIHMKISSLVLWICLFLSLWQCHFNITDRAIEVMLKFIKHLFAVLEEYFNLQTSIAALFPPSLYFFHQTFNKEKGKDSFKKYVVCIKCNKLYNLNDCLSKVQGQQVSKRCNNVLFPNHSKAHLRKPCDQFLLEEVIIRAKTVLVPFKTYCYKPLHDSLNRLFCRKGFLESCSKWKSRQSDDNSVMTDVYDGEVWRNFEKKYPSFFQNKWNICLMVNCDWFAPYKHVKTYSIGAIYAVILNLPRSIRFKKENVILIGLIPNMAKEPPTNTFVEPFVDELINGWNDGFDVKCFDQPSLNVKIAVLCVGCDIPASRKLCGFLGHSATKACNKCEKEFPGGFGCKDYSGFDRANWIPRKNERHRAQIGEICQATTATERKRLESKYGSRFTVFILLPYFDCVKMTVIDPMHNLFCGTGKRMITIWKELGFLSDKNLVKIQEKIDQTICSNDVGKLPSKIEDFNFNNFTADEIKNWTLIFSVFALHDILPYEHMECWRCFILACVYLCNQVLVDSDLVLIDRLLLKFCVSFENLYGTEKVTPNIHLHAHLVDCIRDFGPIYNFWLFSFERYNGILGSISNNKKCIEIQLMRRFERDQNVCNFPQPPCLQETFSPVLALLFSQNDNRGTINDHEDVCLETLKLSSWKTCYTDIKWFLAPEIQMNRKQTVHRLSETEKRCLNNMYKSIYPAEDVFVYGTCWKTSEMSFNNVFYGSEISRSIRSSNIMAFWCGNGGKIQKYEEMYSSPRPGKILFFIKHTIVVNGRFYDHFLAKVAWFLPFADVSIRNYFGKPAMVYRDSFYEIADSALFMPIQRTFCKFVQARCKIRGHNALVCIPRYRNHSI